MTVHKQNYSVVWVALLYCMYGLIVMGSECNQDNSNYVGQLTLAPTITNCCGNDKDTRQAWFQVDRLNVATMYAVLRLLLEKPKKLCEGDLSSVRFDDVEDFYSTTKRDINEEYFLDKKAKELPIALRFVPIGKVSCQQNEYFIDTIKKRLLLAFPHT
ncbi:MAG: hypothetical protein WBQ73_00880, partial [Candidatus Babeliales bacterium]